MLCVRQFYKKKSLYQNSSLDMKAKYKIPNYYSVQLRELRGLSSSSFPILHFSFFIFLFSF